MGCENSKTVRVLPVAPAGGKLSRDNTQMVSGKEGATQTPEAKHKNSSRRHSKDSAGEFDLDEHGEKVKSARRKKKRRSESGRVRSPSKRDLMGSCDSLDDARSLGSDRGFSASSKQSTDSGLGEEYAHVITEFSAESKVQAVEKAFKPRDDLELEIKGVQLNTRHSASDRARLEEAQIMQSLREEGLITKPAAKAAGGMCFEIVEASTAGGASGEPAAVKPPPRLEKLALERRGKKKRVPLTEDVIREKLERAERRRKKREQERLEKLREMERTDAVAALENFAQYQKNKEETLAQRLDQATDNKERQRQQMKEKLERRKRHAEQVRLRKARAKAENEAAGGADADDNPAEERPPSAEVTPRPGMSTPATAMDAPKGSDPSQRPLLQVGEAPSSWGRSHEESQQ